MLGALFGGEGLVDAFPLGAQPLPRNEAQTRHQLGTKSRGVRLEPSELRRGGEGRGGGKGRVHGVFYGYMGGRGGGRGGDRGREGVLQLLMQVRPGLPR